MQGKNGTAKDTLRVPQYSRRRFLKEAGFVAGGAVISSLGLLPSCRQSGTSSPATGAFTTAANKTTPPVTGSGIITSGLPPAAGFVYHTPTELAPVMPIPGCTTSTAIDRKYVVEHMWVKMVAENIVAIGITAKMAMLIDWMYELSLPPEGSKLVQGDNAIYVHGAKLSLDFPNPVSGLVLQKNNEIFVNLQMDVIGDPYNKGWFNTIGLSNPAEWENLLSPQQYTDLNAKVL